VSIEPARYEKMHFLILGPLEVRQGGRIVALGGPQQRAVLAILILHANEVVSRDRLIEGLWGERPPKSAGHILESYVSRLRQALGANAHAAELVTKTHGYSLQADAEQLDVHRFETLVAEGRKQLAAGEPAAAARSLQGALGLFRGPPLDDLAFFPFAQTQVQRLEELRLSALQERIEAELESGRDGDLVAELSMLADEHPFVERFHGQLMLALYRGGRQAEALDIYRRLRRRLVDELGIEPGARLRELEQAILRQEPREAEQPSHSPPAPFRPPATKEKRAGWRWRTQSGRPWTVVAVISCVAVAALLALVIQMMLGDRAATGGLTVGNSIAVLDPSDGGIVGEVALPGPPSHATRGAGALWVSQFEDHSVVRVDPETMRVEETIPVGSGPSAMAIGRGALWVANSLDGTVSRIDPSVNRVVETIPVGSGPSALAFGGGSLWVANTRANSVAQVDAVTGEVIRQTALPGRPTGVAFAAGAVWASSEPVGSVFRIAAESNDVSEIHVGTGPTGIAAGAEAVWVANTLDGTVSRIDQGRGAVTTTLPVGDGPVDVGVASGSVWVANEFDGTVSRIDAQEGEVAQTITVGNRPQGVGAGSGEVWIPIRASSAGHRGGTLRIAASPPSFDTVDPASHNFLSPAQLLGMTNDGLVTLKHVGGSTGNQLVPNLSLTLPTPTDAGRTYRFHVRPGVRYSTGTIVRPLDFRRAIERDFKLHSPGTLFYQGIVGGARCVRRPSRCDLSDGILVNEAANTVTFRLVEPDPDFLYKLVPPYAAAVPAGVSARDVGRRPVPATGPYMIESYVPGRRLRLVRNPYFREWSHAARPDGYVDRIVFELGIDPDRVVTAIERGQVDAGIYDVPFSPPGNRLHELLTGYSAQVHVNPRPQVHYFVMNTRVPPFDDIRVRRALNYAIDRNVLVDLNGGPDLAQPTCQTLPPSIPGYQRYCPYTVNPSPTGAYSGPDLAKARRLVESSGTRGMRVRVMTDPHLRDTGYVVSVLRKLGYRAFAWPVAGDKYNPLASNSRNRTQISVGGTLTDYPAASNIIQTWLSCDGYRPKSDFNNNRAEFCNSTVDAGIARALSLETSNPKAANRGWARVDREIVDQAPWLPTVNLKTVDFVSKRVGNYQFHPQWGLLLDQLWVK
jgi:YVTN family beta-propeller protein